MCLLRVAVERPAPRCIGDHDILEEIERGGMGIVYRARDRALARVVALKIIRSGDLAGDQARARFLAEVDFISRFEHPNIVPIHSANVSPDGYLFYTMPWIEGGSLAKHAARFREPRRAALLIATVARAVQFCHDAKPEPVLHRDLKPENILLGANDHPYLADFGIAKALGHEGSTRSGAIVGTLEYMSPEQASGRGATPASDVYGLGAILYELLTSSPPLGTGSVPELLHRIRYEEPTPPRTRVRALPRDFEKVCLCALEKEPRRRYPSASAFAADLERLLRHEPPLLVMKEPRWRSALAWTRRHPVAAIGALGTVLTLAIAATSTVWLVREQRAELLRSAAQVNAFAARAQAGTMLNQLREYAENVQQATLDENVIAGLQDGASSVSAAVGNQVLAPYVGAFDGMTLFSHDGFARLRWPLPPELLGPRSFAFRDYFRAAVRLGHSKARKTFLAPAYRSSDSDRFQFALAAPVFDSFATFSGVLIARLDTNPAFGTVIVDDSPRSGRVTALIGPHESGGGDANRPLSQHGSPSERYFVLVHPELEHGQERELPQPYAARVRRSFGVSAQPGEQFSSMRFTPVETDDYRDPVTQSPERWLAAFAPVGRTGYVVLVQSRYEDAAPASTTLAANALYVGLPLSGALFLLWAVMMRMTRRAGG